MIPMRLDLPGGGKASVTWASVFWIGVVTTIGTVAGSYLYAKLQARLSSTPATGASS